MAPRTRAIHQPALRDYRESDRLATGQPGLRGGISYVVPGKPVGVNRPNGRKGGRAPFKAKTPEQRAFAARLAFSGDHARRLAGLGASSEPVEVWLWIYFDSERPDTDGPVKPILDSLAASNPKQHRPGAGLLKNDRQVRRYTVERDVDRANPRVEITVKPYSNPSPCDWDQV